MTFKLLSVSRAEKDVINAAMAYHYAVLSTPGLDSGGQLPARVMDALTDLAAATYQLAVTCPDCDAGGHTCPGDGEPIGHSSTNCGQHDDVHREAQGVPAEHEEELTWVLRTWRDVREGDTVRMPGTTNVAHVHSVVHQRWHVDPRSSQYQPTRLEWSCVRVELRTPGNAPGVSYEMDPAKPIEIRLSREELAAIEQLGWETRQGMIQA